MKGWLNYNGKFIEEKTPAVRADNRALRYGEGLFETMKVVLGSIRFKEMHFERLFRGMSLLDIHLPDLVSADKFEEQVNATLLKNRISGPARVRLMVFGGHGGLYDYSTANAGYIIQTWPMQSSALSLNSEGLAVGVYRDAIKSCDKLSNIKTNNYLVYVMAAQHARKNRWNDSLVLNMYGRVCDSTIANIFIVKDGRVFTPPLSEGCVSGVMRLNLIGRVRLEGIPVEEKPLTEEELLDADELFLTNAISGVRWVRQLGEKTYDNKMASRIFSLTM